MSENYKYVRAIADCGDLRWEYQLADSDVLGRMSHDEDVSDWSDDDIIHVTRAMLDVPESVPVEVVWV